MPPVFQQNWAPQQMPSTNLALSNNFANYNLNQMGGGYPQQGYQQQYPNQQQVHPQSQPYPQQQYPTQQQGYPPQQGYEMQEHPQQSQPPL